jgi:hypothetical protein
MIRKKFNKQLFKSNDIIARALAIKYWTSLGINLTNNPDKYGPDLMFDDGSFLEVEIKHTWGDKFPFDTIQLPERKEKFAKLGCKFMMFNKHLTKAFIFDSDAVLNSDKQMVSNKYIPDGEYFFKIPVNKAEVVCVD